MAIIIISAAATLLLLFLIFFIFCFVTFKNTFTRLKSPSKAEAEFFSNLRRRKHSALADRIESDKKAFENRDYKEVTIFCRDEFHLSGRLYIAPNGKGKKSVILCHEFQSIPETDFGAAFRMYSELNYNILLIDHRAHGKSEGKYSSMGIAESFDITDWCKWLEMCFGTECDIIIHGISMGAYAAVVAGANPEMPQNVKAIIAEGVYPHVFSVAFRNAEKNVAFLSKPFIAFTNAFFRNHVGFDMRDLSLFTVAKSVRIPVLFIHSENDSVSLCSDAENIRQRIPVKTEFVKIKKAPHRTCFAKEEKLCSDSVKSFIGEI